MPALPQKLKDITTATDHFASLPKETRTFGQKAADAITGFCGSWRFILGVLTYIAIWIGLNLAGFVWQWDPWPFIILNLTLSCLAALQSPLVLMSQNRQNQRDRINQRYDYLIDRKTSRDTEKTLTEIIELKKMLKKLEEKIEKKA